MAPTPSPTPARSSNSPAARHLHHHLRQALGFSHHPPAQSSVSDAERLNPRTPDSSLQPSVVLEGPSPPPFSPTASGSDSVSAIPVKANQPGNVPGNIVAAVVVVVLILGGLIGLVVGGEMLRRQTKMTGKRVSAPASRGAERRKSKSFKNTSGPSQQRKMDREKLFPYDERTLTPLTRPPPVLDKQRRRKFSDVWPIRSLSRALCNRRSYPEQVERCRQGAAPAASPQTTWSEFSPVSLYVPPRRTVLSRIPEEQEEDCQSRTNGEIGVGTLGVTLRRSLESDSTPQPESAHDVLVEDPVTTERRDAQDFEIIYEAGMKDGDAKSLGSSAPDMTLDGGESSRSSMVSLESLEDGDGRESLREEVFELRRAQTRSMQMNKGVLLSLLPGHGITHGEHGCGSSRPASTANVVEGGKVGDVAQSLSLAMLGGSFSAVNLDEFPSPPSILPMIPSLVSGF